LRAGSVGGGGGALSVPAPILAEGPDPRQPGAEDRRWGFRPHCPTHPRYSPTRGAALSRCARDRCFLPAPTAHSAPWLQGRWAGQKEQPRTQHRRNSDGPPPGSNGGGHGAGVGGKARRKNKGRTGPCQVGAGQGSGKGRGSAAGGEPRQRSEGVGLDVAAASIPAEAVTTPRSTRPGPGSQGAQAVQDPAEDV